MTENNINDLRKARYMSLSCPPASPEAKSLVEDIIDIITKSERRQRARKADEVPVFKSAVGIIIGDLVIGFHTFLMARQVVSFSRFDENSHHFFQRLVKIVDKVVDRFQTNI